MLSAASFAIGVSKSQGNLKAEAVSDQKDAQTTLSRMLMGIYTALPCVENRPSHLRKTPPRNKGPPLMDPKPKDIKNAGEASNPIAMQNEM